MLLMHVMDSKLCTQQIKTPTCSSHATNMLSQRHLRTRICSASARTACTADLCGCEGVRHVNQAAAPRSGTERQRDVTARAVKGGSRKKPAAAPRQTNGAGTAVAEKPVVAAASRSAGEPLLVLEDVAKSHDGETILFNGVTLTVHRGERLAMVGVNGSGKTSLLRIMAGADEPDDGSVKRNNGVRLGYLEQDPEMDPELTILESVLASDAEAARVVQNYDRILSGSKVANGVCLTALEADRFRHAGTSSATELNEAHAMMDRYNAWALDAEARLVLEELGCQDIRAKVGSLSGGQKRRAALAAALMSKPDILLLDEPTNHLDLHAIQWAEERLRSRDSSLVLITHDRAFLEALATGIVELDRDGVHLHEVSGPGCYNRFREARAARRAAAAAVAADARTLLRKESEWMSRQPKARQAKQKARQDAYFELLNKAKSGPRRDFALELGNASLMARQGNKVLEVEDAAVHIGGKEIIRDFTYDFNRGERIGIVGPNGAGKSTLLAALSGQLALAAGHRIEGDTTVTGYFSQHTVNMKPHFSILEWIRDEVVVGGLENRPPSTKEDAEYASEVAAVTANRAASGGGDEMPALPPEVLLEQLGFPRPVQQRKIGLLSGGQKRRLQLAGVLRARPNLLLVDEPTNDLDLSTIEALEELLSEYKGVLLAVSHDRAFLDACTDKLFVLQGDGLVRLFDGPYSEYLQIMERREKQQQRERARQKAEELEQQRAASATAASSGASSANGAAAQKPGLRLSFRERQELENLEAEVAELGEQKAQLDKAIDAHAAEGDFGKLTAATEKLAGLAALIDAKTERWLELEERAELAG